ncbi:MAG: DUF4960 domain-containing protein [Bacteroidales bacterium]|nr:DUF4960 domain-containing protein [Bacteroidales bacterium]MCF8399462.1 DUF4960 domain-containing protein [Bacteroidales bacterium]
MSSKSYGGSHLEIQASFDFLKHYANNLDSELISFVDITEDPSLPEKFDVIWFHEVDTSDFSEQEKDPVVVRSLLKYLKNGGGIILSMTAMRYINALGIEPIKPALRWKEARDQGYGRKLGLHAFRRHPVFKELHGGAYVYKPVLDMKVPQMGYFDERIPAKGKVVAVDWEYIFLREDDKLVLEYNIGQGTLIAIGAYVHFGAPNFNRKHLDKFILNSIEYLANGSDIPAYYWNYTETEISEKDPERLDIKYQPAMNWPEDSLSLMLQRLFATENYFEVSTDRLLIMGKEKGGIQEIWAHPFMALRDYEVGIRFSYGDSIYWLNDQTPGIEVRPNSFSREYKFKRAYLTEIITAQMHEPTAVIHYEYRGVYPAELYIKFKSNFRYMWPYDHQALGNLFYTRDKINNVFLLQDKSEDFNVMLGSNKRIYAANIGQFEDFTINPVPPDLDKPVAEEDVLQGIPTEDYLISGIMKLDLEMNEDLDILFSAGGTGEKEIIEVYEKTAGGAYEIYRQSASYYQDLLEYSLCIQTPNRTFNEGYKWALIASDKFFVHTPGIGKSLVAGYATTNKGWDGGHVVNGRPGYAWYFGRDAIWSAFALLDYGDFEKTKAILENFQDYQDLSGKIYHELSTSGIVHYDASDATPLYIILAGRYLSHTGDLDFIRKSWPHIHKAIEFCFSTDTDADHLIENTNVGHGWVEGGHLFGSHTSLHLASLWGEALHQSAYMASLLKKEELADHYAYESKVVSELIDTLFYNDSTRYYYHGLYQDGSFLEEQTIMPAIPMYFGQTPPEKAAPILKEFASNAFNSDWGIRILKKESDKFNPRGYHTGSVWPLFTGWTALAEYQYGNKVQGYTHIMNNLKIYQNWAKGFLEEVLNGAEYSPSGVCAHQCWSETMVLQPIVEGLIGFEPNAPEQKLKLHPAFPANWDHISIKNLRFDKNAFDFEMKRTKGKTTYWVRPKYQNEFSLDFNPLFPEGTQITEIRLNGKVLPSGEVMPQSFSELKLKLDIKGDYRIDVKHKHGIEVLPSVPNPKPGDASTGLRIPDAKLLGNRYYMKLEAKPGSNNEILVYIADRMPVRFGNLQLLEIKGNIFRFKVLFDENGEEYVEKEVNILLE